MSSKTFAPVALMTLREKVGSNRISLGECSELAFEQALCKLPDFFSPLGPALTTLADGSMPDHGLLTDGHVEA